MSRFPMISRFFASLPRIRASRSLLAVAAIAVVAMPGTADAAEGSEAPMTAPGPRSLPPRGGNCSSGYSVPFLVSGTRVSSAGGGRVSGSVGRGGSVAVAVSVGASHASGGGRLVGNSGSGRWSGIITGDRCSGTWQATRS